jgi:cell division protein FtsQ
MYLGKTRLGHLGRNAYQGTLSDSGLSWLEKLWHHFWVGSMIMLVVAGVSLAMIIGYFVALSTPIFKLEDISFQGLKRVSQGELLKKAGLENGVNLLALNLNDVKKNMESLPWIKSVALQRELPNKLRVAVAEYQPVFLVLVERDLYYLDETGVLFYKVEGGQGPSLPLLTGLSKGDWTASGQMKPQIFQEVIRLKGYLSQGQDPFYPEKLSEIHFDPDCGFSLFTLERGIRISLGKEELQSRVQRLEKVWTELSKRPHLEGLKGISLQFGQRIIVHGVRTKGRG